MSVERLDSGSRMSRAVCHGDTVYLSGNVADNPNDDTAGQTRQVLAKIDKALADAGTGKSQLVSANIYLADISTFEEMNGVWDRWVVPGNTPARTTVEAKLARPGLKVEITIVAARRKS